MRFVPQQFFPASDRPELLVNLTLPFIDHRFLLVDGITQHESHYLNACGLLPEQSKSRGRFVVDIDFVMDFLVQSKII